jgi:hypothetical protein
MLVIPISKQQWLNVALFHISPIANDVEYLIMYLFLIIIPSGEVFVHMFYTF